MTREEIYTQQLQALGIYEPAFDPAIKNLAQLERELTRAQKAWKKTVPDGVTPSFLDPHFAVISQLRRDIMTLRDTLGLTPKALQRIRGKTAAPESETDGINSRLDALAARISTYE